VSANLDLPAILNALTVSIVVQLLRAFPSNLNEARSIAILSPAAKSCDIEAVKIILEKSA
jgi:hypothetical protein